MKRRFILITIIGLLLLMLPLMAGAEIVDSGTCGDNLTWTLDSNYVLTINGTGPMADYSNSIYPSWTQKVKAYEIKAIVLSRGITTIGDEAFYGCSSVESITVPSGVTSIGYRAFKGCKKVKSISLPSTVQSIGDYAFDDCNALTSLSIPSTVTTIGDHAFFIVPV